MPGSARSRAEGGAAAATMEFATAEGVGGDRHGLRRLGAIVAASIAEIESAKPQEAGSIPQPERRDQGPVRRREDHNKGV